MILTEALLLAGLKAADTWGQVLLSPEGQEWMKTARADAERFRQSLQALREAFPPLPLVKK
jgi:hypothetical protein